MKKVMLAIVGLCICAALSAQNYPFFPKEGKVYNYSLETRSPQGTITLASKQSAKFLEDGRLELTTGAEVDGKIESDVTIWNVTEKGYSIALDAMGKSGFQQFEDIQCSDVEEFEVPKEMKVGDKLPDCSMKIKGTIQGMELDMTYTICERKIVKGKKITTPAGTYETIAVKYTIVIDMGIQTVASDVVEYYAEGVGCVSKVVDTMGGMATVTMTLTSIE